MRMCTFNAKSRCMSHPSVESSVLSKVKNLRNTSAGTKLCKIQANMIITAIILTMESITTSPQMDTEKCAHVWETPAKELTGCKSKTQLANTTEIILPF